MARSVHRGMLPTGVGSVGIHLQSCKGCVGGLWFSCGIASVKGILGLRGEGGTGR